jgi:glyoxylase-like metal-dependent hydrolase (beta-lactamase superfamily II)
LNGERSELFSVRISNGPFHVDFGLDIMQWRESMEKLLDLKADILCEGHFGIFT